MFALSLSGFLAFLQSSIFLVGYISNNSLFPEPLTSEEEKKYLELLKNGDEDARNILIERNLRLVAHVCKKYATTKVEQDDLISIGTIGLIKGINSFDPSKGVRLATYVSRCVDNEVLMHLRATKTARHGHFRTHGLNNGFSCGGHFLNFFHVAVIADSSIGFCLFLKSRRRLFAHRAGLQF